MYIKLMTYSSQLKVVSSVLACHSSTLETTKYDVLMILVRLRRSFVKGIQYIEFPATLHIYTIILVNTTLKGSFTLSLANLK